MTNTLTLIDRAVLLGVGEYAPFVAFRKQLRGGDGFGENIQAGHVPRRMPTGGFDARGFRLPALWISRSLIAPDETQAIHYSVELACVLPSLVNGAKITGDQIQEAVDLLLQAGLAPDNVERTSIAGRLKRAGKTQCVQYVFEKLACDGRAIHPEITARIRFLVPFQALTGTFLGVRNA